MTNGGNNVIIQDGTTGSTNVNVVRVITQTVETSDTTVNSEVNRGYILTGGTLQTINLPTPCIAGDVVLLDGKGTGLFRVAQRAGEQILFGNTPSTIGVTGYIESTHANDGVYLKCVDVSGIWKVDPAPLGEWDIDGTKTNNAINSLPINLSSPGNNVDIAGTYPNVTLDVGATSSGTDSIVINNSVPAAHGNSVVALGDGAAATNQGDESVAIGHGAAATNQGVGSIVIGNNAVSSNASTRCVAIGHGCANPNSTGRLGFGSQMEPITALGGISAPQAGYLNLAWNGTHYRIPVFDNSISIGLVPFMGVSPSSYGDMRSTTGVFDSISDVKANSFSIGFDKNVTHIVGESGSGMKPNISGVYQISASANGGIISSVNNTHVSFRFWVYKNGSRLFGAGNGGFYNQNSLNLSASDVQLFTLSENDLLDVYIQVSSTNETFTLEDSHLSIMLIDVD